MGLESGSVVTMGTLPWGTLPLNWCCWKRSACTYTCRPSKWQFEFHGACTYVRTQSSKSFELYIYLASSHWGRSKDTLDKAQPLERKINTSDWGVTFLFKKNVKSLPPSKKYLKKFKVSFVYFFIITHTRSGRRPKWSTYRWIDKCLEFCDNFWWTFSSVLGCMLSLVLISVFYLLISKIFSLKWFSSRRTN